MRKGPMLPTEFSATQWSNESDKADFGNALLHFIDSDFKQGLFTRKLYERLSNTFGHIAHYCQSGFWEEWFTTDVDKVRFIEHLLRWPCHGDPKFTFSDIERALQREVKSRDYLFRYRALADASVRAREVAMLERLEAKYRSPRAGEATTLPAPIKQPDQKSRGEETPIQGTLF